MLLRSDKLLSVDKNLVRLIEEVGRRWDVIVVCGFRNQESQDSAFKAHKSKLQWPHSAHNKTPSKAVDVASYDVMSRQIDWEDKTCQELRQHIEEVAKELFIQLKPSISWDILHIELK